ncbi:MAG TPA: hypothetical protein VE197_05525, partial [Mycobacterium sp.]|nr:hypothetical protein [Mycobacterium sp.]
MDIAAAVRAERLREIMTELVERSAAMVQRYGGTVEKFTGDGIMAVFGAPVALEDSVQRESYAQHLQHGGSLLPMMQAAVRDDRYPRLADITVPTVVMVGSADLATPPRHSRRLADGIPGARL